MSDIDGYVLDTELEEDEPDYSEVDNIGDEPQMPFDAPMLQDRYFNKTSDFRDAVLEYLNDKDACPFMKQTVDGLKIFVKACASRDVLMSNGDPRTIRKLGTTVDPIQLALDDFELEMLKLSDSCAAVDWGSAPMEDLLGKIAENFGFHLSRTHGKDKETVLNRKETVAKELTQSSIAQPAKPVSKKRSSLGGLFP